MITDQSEIGGVTGTTQGLLAVGVASSSVSIGLGLVYWVARIGFENPVTPVFSAVGLGLLFVNVPVLLWLALRSHAGSHLWARSWSFLWLVTFSIIALIGRLVIVVGANPSALVGPLGAVAFVAVAVAWARGTSIRAGVLLLLGSGFFSTWVAGVVWGRIYKSPVFMEMLIANGTVHHDGLVVAALGNMLRTYHAASVGMDGFGPYMAYHWGTPWLFAQFSNLTGESLLQFYQLGFPITMIPLFFGGVVAFAVQMRGAGFLGRGGETAAPTVDYRRFATRDLLFWGIFLAATVGVFPITGTDALGVWTSNLMISESYTVGIPFGLMLLATVMVFWTERGESVTTGNAGVLDYMFLAMILPGGLAALGYIKISVMVLGFGAVGYAALRLGAWRRWILVAIGIWVTAIVYVTYGRVSLVAHYEGMVPLDFMKGFVPRVWWPFFFLVHLFWPTLYVALRLRREGARTVGDVVALGRTGRILDAEVVAMIAIAGVLPGLILHIDGGSAFYFSDVQRWVAVGFLLAGLTNLLPRTTPVRFTQLRSIAIVFVAIPLAVSMARNSVYWTARMLKVNAELRHSLYPAGEAVLIPPGIRSLPHLTNSAKLAVGLRRAPNYNAVEGLLELSKVPLTEKGRTAVFVPQTEGKYWTILTRPNACSYSGFLVPSLSGMSMIDGMPPPGCALSPYYGLSLFQKRTRPQTEADTQPANLCARATSKGFDRVIELHFDADGRVTSRAIECRSAS